MDYAGMFARVSTAEGGKVRLTPVYDGLAPDVLEACLESKADLVRFMPWDCDTIDDAQGFVSGSIQARVDGARLELAIIDKDSGQFAGMIGLKSLDPFTPRCEVGYWVRSSMTGRGVATDAVRTLLGLCRDQLGFARIDAIAAENNAGSRRVLTKAGFVEEGFKRRAELCHGVWLDMVMYGVVFE